MNETQIIEEIANRLFLTKTEVEETLDFLIEKITKELKQGERIYIRKFGALQKVKRKKRRVRNINTGRMITIPERETVEFRPSPALEGKIAS